MVNPATINLIRGALLLSGSMALVQWLIDSATAAALVFALVLVLYAASFALHEAGHYLVALMRQANPRWASPAVESSPRRRRDAIIISVAGPLLGQLPALVIMLAGRQLPPGLLIGSLGLWCNHLAMLLPAFPDGKVLYQTLIKERLT